MYPCGSYSAEWRQPSALALCGHHRSIGEATNRVAAEEEEKEFYNKRAPKEWLEAFAPLGTDEHKPFLEIAPYLIAIFEERYGRLPTCGQVKHYYPKESVGIATGLLITAIQQGPATNLHVTPRDTLKASYKGQDVGGIYRATTVLRRVADRATSAKCLSHARFFRSSICLNWEARSVSKAPAPLRFAGARQTKCGTKLVRIIHELRCFQ